MAIFLMVVACAFAVSRELPLVAQSSGAQAQSLTAIRDVIQQHMNAGDILGGMVLVAHDGKLAYLEAQGVYDEKSKTPLKTDTIFWCASMTEKRSLSRPSRYQREGGFQTRHIVTSSES